MITFSRNRIEIEEDVKEDTPKWKVSLERQLSQCIKEEYSEELISKFENVKNVNSLCKKISKSVLNSIYEEDILKSISIASKIEYDSDMNDDSKLKISKKLRRSFQSEYLEFLRYEILDSISRLKKEWLNI